MRCRTRFGTAEHNTDSAAFIEKLLSLDTKGRYFIRTCGEEPHLAYNRVGLTGARDEIKAQPSLTCRILPAP